MKTKKKLLSLIFAAALIFSGCENRLELNNLVMISSCIYDIDDKNNIYVQVEAKRPIASEEENLGKSFMPVNLSARGKTSFDALDNLQGSYAPNLTTAFIKVNLLTENIAKHGVTSVLDYILRDNEIKENSLVVVIKDKNLDKLDKSYYGLDRTLGDYIENLSYHQPNANSSSAFVSIFDFIHSTNQKGIEAVCGVCEIVEKEELEMLGQSEDEADKKEMKIKYEGLAVFNGPKLVGFLDGKETEMYNLIVNKFHKGIVYVKNEQFEGSIEILKAKTKIETKYEEGKVKIAIYPKVNFSVIEIKKGDVASKKEHKKQIEEALNQILNEQIKSVVEKTKNEYQSDIFGFGLYFENHNTKAWQNLSNNWNKHFKEAEITVSTKSYLINTKQLSEPLIKR